MKKTDKPLFQIDWAKRAECIVRITPEDAKRILDQHNEGNRFLRKAGSRYIAAQILAGEWKEEHPQPICFSSEGKLLDGQHRISGIVLGGVSVWASCKFGVDPSMIQYLDTGISRTLGDRIEFVEHKNQNNFIAAMINMRHSMKVKSKPSPEQAMGLFYEMPDSYREIARLRVSKRYVGTTVVALAFADYHNLHGNEALVMYHELFQMATECQPAQALKGFLVDTNKKGTVLYPYVVSACLANHQGRRVKVLRAAAWR